MKPQEEWQVPSKAAKLWEIYNQVTMKNWSIGREISQVELAEFGRLRALNKLCTNQFVVEVVAYKGPGQRSHIPTCTVVWSWTCETYMSTLLSWGVPKWIVTSLPLRFTVDQELRKGEYEWTWCLWDVTIMIHSVNLFRCPMFSQTLLIPWFAYACMSKKYSDIDLHQSIYMISVES